MGPEKKITSLDVIGGILNQFFFGEENDGEEEEESEEDGEEEDGEEEDYVETEGEEV